MSKKPLEIDMIAGSQLRDTQGEMLSVEGADISDLIAGRGRFNDNHGKGFYNSIGRVTSAKKIFKAEDCTTDRHKYYWEKVKAPFIYVAGNLYDDQDHPNARAAAAILRNVHKADAPLKIKASVEGGVISRGVSDQSLLARTKIHSVALTFTPANNATLVEPTSLDKSSYDEAADMELIKSVAHLAETDVPSFRYITRDAGANKILANMEQIHDIATQLGIPTNKLPFPSKEQIIKSSVEEKVATNIQLIHEMITELSKAKLGKEADAYNIGTTGPSGSKIRGLTGDNAIKAQNHAIKTLLSYPRTSIVHPYQSMNNIETGKPEMHILVHHGVDALSGDKTGTAHKRRDQSSMPVGGNEKEHNSFSVKDGVVDHPTYGVHTLFPSVADEYSDSDREGSAGGTHSFWVPVSKIHSMRDYDFGRFKNPNQKLPKGKTEADRDELSHSEHAADQSHIVIRPGKYKQVSKKDLEEQHNSIEKHIKGKEGEDESTHDSPLSRGKHFTSDGVVDSKDYKKKNLNKSAYSGSKTDKFPKALGAMSMDQDSPEVMRHHMGLHQTHALRAADSASRKYHLDQVKQIGDHLASVKKAMTAGYGGAGAPSSMVGGTVIQVESLENPKKKKKNEFSFIKCDDCGREQVFHKHQVKCRDCMKSFPLEKIYKVMDH